MRSYFLLIIGSTVTIVLDQLSKVWAVEKLLVPTGPLPAEAHMIRTRVDVVFESWFNYRLAGNKGAAFGLFRDLPEGMRVPFFLVICLIAIVAITVMYRKSEGQRLFRVALTLILGGAIGNLIDRIRFGYVVDFIDWFYKTSHWPTFNVADIAISVGVGLMVIDMIINKEHHTSGGSGAASVADQDGNTPSAN